MTRVIYNTATTLNGFLADDADSLSWLFAVPDSAEAESAFPEFLRGIGAIVMGAATYEWILAHERLLERPEAWPYPALPCFVLTTRDLPAVAGADLRRRHGDVAALWPEIADAAGSRDVWLVGGGDLVGQFADAGRLDEVRVSVAPVTLESGKPLLPRRLEADRLSLLSVGRTGQFAELVYAVRAR